MPGDDAPDEREAGAGAFEFVLVVQSLEQPEQFVCVVGVESGAVVLHVDPPGAGLRVVVRADVQVRLRTVAGVLEGVAAEGGQDGPQCVHVARYDWQGRGGPLDLGGAWVECPLHLGVQVIQVGGLDAQRAAAGATEAHDAVDHAGEVRGARLDDAEVAVAFAGVGRLPGEPGEAQEVPDGCEQVVGHGVGDVLEFLVRLEEQLFLVAQGFGLPGHFGGEVGVELLEGLLGLHAVGHVAGDDDQVVGSGGAGGVGHGRECHVPPAGFTAQGGAEPGELRGRAVRRDRERLKHRFARLAFPEGQPVRAVAGAVVVDLHGFLATQVHGLQPAVPVNDLDAVGTEIVHAGQVTLPPLLIGDGHVAEQERRRGAGIHQMRTEFRHIPHHKV